MGHVHPIPVQLLRIAGPGERAAAAEAHAHGRLVANWELGSPARARGHRGKPPIDGPPRGWAKAHGWPTPWFFFERAFLERMLATDEDFDLALRETGVEVYIPKEEIVVSAQELRELDQLYKSTDSYGRPDGWGSLVADLRELRRAVELGVVVKVEGTTLTSFNSFYSWAHGRYHALEDGYDSWIGDDDS